MGIIKNYSAILVVFFKIQVNKAIFLKGEWSNVTMLFVPILKNQISSLPDM